MYVQRDLEGTLCRHLLEGAEFVAVTGPRQAGKTTLVEHVLSTITDRRTRAVTFEDEDTLSLFNEDVKAFSALHLEGTDVLFIDEFQHAREGGRRLKYLFDVHAKRGKKIVISGSSALELSLESIQPLVGRLLVFELYPLSFGEFLRSREPELYEAMRRERSTALLGMAERHLEEFVTYGGYPRVALAPDAEEKRLLLKSLYELMVKKDIRGQAGAAEAEELKRLLVVLASQAGGLLNHHGLSEAMGASFRWVKEKMALLQWLYLVRELKPFYRNKRLEVTKMPKLFFIDTGLLNHITGNRALSGPVVENYAFSELLKQGLELNYWRTKSKAEVDFVIDRTYPLEVKLSSRTSRSLHSFVDKYAPERAFVAGKAPTGTGAFTGVPLSMLWSIKGELGGGRQGS